MLGKIRDLNLRWFITAHDNHLVLSRHEQKDIGLSDKANDLILIATRKEASDILSFLHHHLCIVGEAGLGLYVKNLVDVIVLNPIFAVLRAGLLQLDEFIKINVLEGVYQYDHARLSC
ncbi:ubiquinone anaerobic biosynthesis accessory factor UbiT [Photorhabdus heterorhabditis]|uniref:ubiquinone anaerobic biosynthesis accessory factor UbiT n=1 Tax=Photorhabdus heterorhabditis TaxID=880156 RepID=UPI0006C86C7E|nr:hypothetical protein [Photorhabdus heterorhabditis]